MTFKYSLRTSGTLILVTALSGGFGTSGGTGPAKMTSYDNAYKAVQEAPTTTVLSGTASYSGRARIDLPAVASSANVVGYMEGDLELTMNFAGGPNSVSGTATNFSGEIDGTETTVSGTLTTAASSGVNQTTSQTVAVPVIGNVTTTGLFAALNGDLTNDATQETMNVELGLLGTFVGANGKGSFGASSTIIIVPGEPNVITGGTYYLTRD